MRYFLFLISLILLATTLFFQEIGVLYRFSAGSKIHEWKHFGNQGKDPKFMGEINDGSPDGFGIEINPDGFIYKGKFRQGKWDGNGTFYYPDGRKYVGEWKGGMRDGQGIYFSSNGNEIYVGSYKQDKKHGQGSLTLSDGLKYMG